MKKKTTLNKTRIFLLAFIAIVVVLFIIKTCNPAIMESRPDFAKGDSAMAVATAESKEPAAEIAVAVSVADTLKTPIAISDSVLHLGYKLIPELRDSSAKAHGLYYFGSYELAFPDINDVQLVYANAHGMKPLKTQAQIKARSGKELVHIGNSPYYHVDELTSSVPYLVPRAQVLLNAIARNFTDSLFAKHLPQAQLIVTSGTRSTDDVAKLQTKNQNSTTNSCHFYGTTIDISYVRFHQLKRPDGTKVRLVRDDTLKQVLGEVLNDLRTSGACYVKHEKKQSCFHITVR